MAYLILKILRIEFLFYFCIFFDDSFTDFSHISFQVLYFYLFVQLNVAIQQIKLSGRLFEK